jgi:hypothetical protein
VVQALADLWTQYYLLALAAVEDTTLSNVDVSPLVRRQVEGELVTQLRDQVIQVDTSFTDEELRARYEVELPGGRVRGRHILLQYPEGATPAQEDSVRALAESLRSRILEGESFEALAQEYSQDAGTAESGGDLGSFGKGEMVPPFEEAAFGLEAGEISDVVETAFGLHIIRVDERIVPPFEESREQFRTQLRNQLVMQAESTYVAGLMDGAGLEVDEEQLESVKQLASEPGVQLSSRAQTRPLVHYNEGSYTLGEFRTWLLTSPPNIPPQIAGASDEQLRNLLRSLTQSELLVAEARREGLEVPEARQDSIADGLVSGMKGIARELGFFELEVQEGESPRSAAARAVQDILVQVVQEGREVYPLQTVAFALKEQFGARIFQPGVERTVSRVEELRAESPPTPAPPTRPSALPDTAVPDTSAPDTSGSSG